jgi:hypothetical protein
MSRPPDLGLVSFAANGQKTHESSVSSADPWITADRAGAGTAPDETIPSESQGAPNDNGAYSEQRHV